MVQTRTSDSNDGILMARGVKRRRARASDNYSDQENVDAPREKKVRHHQPPSSEDATEALLQQQFLDESQQESNYVDSTKADEEDDRPHLDQIREVISGELSTEILLLHRTSRLVKQEAAKMQICVEQLRRVAVVPYDPQAPPPTLLAGTSADGLRSANSSTTFIIDRHATNGAYMQHYATWLLPHPLFRPEDLPKEPPPPVAAALPPIQTRSAATLQTKVSKEAKGSKEPTHPSFVGCLMHRQSDDQTVVLICTHCGKRDFTAPTGAINHVAIKHNHKLASHQDAADKYGHPVIRDEAGMIVGPLDVTYSSEDNKEGEVEEGITRQDIPMPDADGDASTSHTPDHINPNNYQTPHLAQRMKARRQGLNYDQLLQDVTQSLDPSNDSEDPKKSASKHQPDRREARSGRTRTPTRRALGLDGSMEVSSDEETPRPLHDRFRATKGYRERLGRSPAPKTLVPASLPSSIPDSDESADESDLTTMRYPSRRLRSFNPASNFPKDLIIPSSQPEMEPSSPSAEPSLVSDDGEEVVSRDLSSEADQDDMPPSSISQRDESVIEDSQDESLIMPVPGKPRVRRPLTMERRARLRGEVSRTRNGTIIKHDEQLVSIMEKRRAGSQTVHR